MLIHPISPVFDERSEILILGSFPSVKSREAGFFYGNPYNRFWRVLSAVFNDELPVSNCEKRSYLLRHRIALWDVICSCEVEGSADSTISNVIPNDISVILDSSPIKKIYANGKTATKYYKLYCEPSINRPSVYLPSTSPANASWNFDMLVEAWKKIIL